MPIRLPDKHRSEAKTIERIDSIDWLTLWAMSVGVSAIIMASVVDFVAEDRLGAALILIGAAAIMAVALRAAKPRGHS